MESVARQADAEPYEAGSGPRAVLLCHGFTSTPQSMRPWADHLEHAGFRVSVPLLPGHGRTWQELNRVPWTAWYDEVEQAFGRLRAAGGPVFVTGLSMGACLGLRLAEQHGAAVAGLVLVNPVVRLRRPDLLALPVLRWLTPSVGAIANDIALTGPVEVAYDRTPLHALASQTRMWRDVRDHLDRVTAPLLIYRSQTDHVVDAASVPIIRSRVSSTDVTVRSLTRSFHLATLDHEAPDIFAGSVEFFDRLSGG